MKSPENHLNTFIVQMETFSKLERQLVPRSASEANQREMCLCCLWHVLYSGHISVPGLIVPWHLSRSVSAPFPPRMPFILPSLSICPSNTPVFQGFLQALSFLIAWLEDFPSQLEILTLFYSPVQPVHRVVRASATPQLPPVFTHIQCLTFPEAF